MKTLVDHLSQYAAYHRDPRNIQTHFIGIPMIVVAVAVLLSRPTVMVGELPVSPALGVALLSSLFYFRLDLRLGAVMGMVLAATLVVGQWLAHQTTVAWLASGLGLFVLGWAIQFVGHHFEGRKPAFVDDITGLIVGPLFVAAELGFLMGWRKPLESAITERAGPVRLRDAATAADPAA